MFLRLSLICILLLINSAISFSEITETPHHTKRAMLENVRILEQTIKREPKDMLTLHRLVKLTFTLEQFTKTLYYSKRYLALKKDKVIAYLRIISLASIGRYRAASQEIGLFIKNYSLSKTEKKLLLHKKKLYTQSGKPRPHPIGVRRLQNKNNIELRSILYREDLVFGYDTKHNKAFFTKMNASLNAEKKPLPFLKGLNLNKTIYLSQSTNGREILASVKHKTSSEILYRYYIPNDKEWSSWHTVNELNPGTNNLYANFIPNSDSVILCSDADSDTGYDIYIVNRKTIVDWLEPKKLPAINTVLNEISVAIHPDGKTVYFSTNGRPGSGGYDLYSAQLYKKNNTYKTRFIRNLVNINTYRNEITPPLINTAATVGLYSLKTANKNMLYSGKTTTWPQPTFFAEGFVYYEDSKEPAQYTQLRKGSVTVYAEEDGFYSIALKKYAYHSLNASKDNSLKTITGFKTPGGHLLQKNIQIPYPEKLITASLPKDRQLKLIVYTLAPVKTSWQKSLRVTAALSRKLGKHSQIKLLFSKKLKNKLKDNNLKQTCYSQRCALTSGKKLQSDYVITGTITEIEEKYKQSLGKDEGNQYLMVRKKRSYFVVIIDLYNIETRKKVSRFKITFRNPFMQQAANKLYKKTMRALK